MESYSISMERATSIFRLLSEILNFKLMRVSLILDLKVEPVIIHGSKHWVSTELLIPEGHSSKWNSNEGHIQLERTSTTNSITVSIPDLAETVIPVSEEDNKIHNYQIPENDKLIILILRNPTKLGVAMLVVGSDYNYKTSSLLATDCALCIFSLEEKDEKMSPLMDYGMLDGKGGGNGITCKK
ncbi:late embryogenesis abundant protein-related protein [Tanacetum coccineum]